MSEEETVEENMAVVRRATAAANRQDSEAWAEVFSQDVTNHGQPRGRDGMRGIFRSLLQAFPDWHFTERLIVANGDYVVAEQVMTGTHLGTPELPVLGGLLAACRRPASAWRSITSTFSAWPTARSWTIRRCGTTSG